jgi:hypothetical protein
MHGPVLSSDAHTTGQALLCTLNSYWIQASDCTGMHAIASFLTWKEMLLCSFVCSIHPHASSDASAQTRTGAAPQTASKDHHLVCLTLPPACVVSQLLRDHSFTRLSCRCVILMPVALCCVV